MPTDDMTLLREFAATRSETAFAQIVARHLNLVHAAALRRTGDAPMAEEVAQAVFLILARKAGSLGPKTILTGWLYRTTQYAAADALKQQRRRQQREHQAYMETTFNPPETAAAWQQIAPVLEAAMDGLGERDRHAVLLRYFEQRTLAEVGAALGMSEDGARLRVNRALDKLRAKLGKAGVTLGAALIVSAVTTNSVQAAPVGLAAKVSVIAAKGAATTTSITTLVKGTLKIMAWTKAKMAIGAAAGLILATSVSVVVVEKESLVQGKTESEWIKSIVYNGDEQQRELWHSLGPKGIKMLLHAMKPPSAGLAEEETNTNRQTRMKAANLLGSLENIYNDAASAVPDVIKLLQSEKDGRVRGLEVGYFELPIQSMSEKNKAALLPELIRSTQSMDASEQNNALVSLQYYTNQQETVVPLIVNAMQDSSPLVRMMAVKALNKIDPQNPASSNSVSVLAGCVTAPPGNTPSAANEAIVALGEFHRKPEVAVPALIKALGSDQFWARANAAAALGKFGGQARAAIPALQKALDDSDASVRKQAVAALKRINSEATAK